MPNLRIDGQFKTEIITLVQKCAADSNLVSLVMRWDQNDAYIKSIDSLPIGQTIVPGGGAAHAEEVMIANWPQYAHAFGVVPHTVEVFISKSPCMDRSPVRTINGVTFVKGCSNKLEAFISRLGTGVNWRICFLNYYQEDVRVEAQSHSPAAVFSRLSNVDIYKFQDRHQSL